MRVIAHIDMDAFFASVEQRDNPLLRGRPVVVGADPKKGLGRGVVSTCSYEARVFGIHSAMPISKAYRLCPHAAFLPPNGKAYRRASAQFFSILEKFSPDIEPISIDEAFVDLTGCWHFYGSPEACAQRMKDAIRREIQLTCSVGLAPIKMAAKIASDVCKPDGLLNVPEDKLLEFLHPLPVERLWGVGPKSKAQLHRLGLKTIGDIARMSSEEVFKNLGEVGLHWQALANGEDPRTVEVHEEMKSVSHEHTFDTDTSDAREVVAMIKELSQAVSRRMRKEGLKGRTVTLKIRLESFKTFSRSKTLDERTNFVDDITRCAVGLFKDFLKGGMTIRLIGVRLTNFEDAYVQESLFENPNQKRKEQIHLAVDVLKNKFGEQAIRWGG